MDGILYRHRYTYIIHKKYIKMLNVFLLLYYFIILFYYYSYSQTVHDDDDDYFALLFCFWLESTTKLLLFPTLPKKSQKNLFYADTQHDMTHYLISPHHRHDHHHQQTQF